MTQKESKLAEKLYDTTSEMTVNLEKLHNDLTSPEFKNILKYGRLQKHKYRRFDDKSLSKIDKDVETLMIKLDEFSTAMYDMSHKRKTSSNK